MKTKKQEKKMEDWIDEIAEEVYEEIEDWMDSVKNPTWEKTYRKALKTAQWMGYLGEASEIAEIVADWDDG
jgi:hypothetical protein